MEFKEAMESGDFICKASEDTCRFCKYDKICGKPKDVEQDTGE
jgi:hypothetical protein